MTVAVTQQMLSGKGKRHPLRSTTCPNCNGRAVKKETTIRASRVSAEFSCRICGARWPERRSR